MDCALQSGVKMLARSTVWPDSFRLVPIEESPKFVAYRGAEISTRKTMCFIEIMFVVQIQ